jgi:hypothetical protein
MPVTSPRLTLGESQAERGNRRPMRPVRLTASVFPPCHFIRIGLKPIARHPVMNAEFRPLQPGEIAFGLIGGFGLLGYGEQLFGLP